MRNTNQKLKKRLKGSILAYVLVIMTVVMIVLVSMIGYITSQLKFSLNRVEKERAFQIAEAGVYYYRWYLAHKTSAKTPQEISAFWQDGGELGFDFEDDYEGMGRYQVTVNKPSNSSTIAIVESTGWTYKDPNLKRTVRVRFRKPSWSEYMFLTHSFLAFGTGAEVYGKVYSSSGVRFNGLAHNVVSALPPRFNDPDYGGSSMEFGVYTQKIPADPSAPPYPWPEGTVPDRPDVFEAGRQFPVPEISFNGVTLALGDMKTEAQKPNGTIVNGCNTTNCYFNYDTGEDSGKRIILKSNGDFDICTVADYQHTLLNPKNYRENGGTGTCNSCGGNECTQTYAIPHDGIIFVEGNAWVDGVVDDKRITIAAANLSGGTAANIYIGMGNIRYASYDCDNIIGLVAQKDISIIKDCPDDFIVDAALLSQTGRVNRGNYSLDRSSLTFNGAIASYLQPYFNTGNNGFGVRNYFYDNNLLYCPPPFFPTGTEYSIDLWEEL